MFTIIEALKYESCELELIIDIVQLLTEMWHILSMMKICFCNVCA